MIEGVLQGDLTERIVVLIGWRKKGTFFCPMARLVLSGPVHFSSPRARSHEPGTLRAVPSHRSEPASIPDIGADHPGATVGVKAGRSLYAWHDYGYTPRGE